MGCPKIDGYDSGVFEEMACELTLPLFFDSLEPRLIEEVSDDRYVPEMSF